MEPLDKDKNRTEFTKEAQRSKVYTFLLLDEGKLHGYSLVRNGASVGCTGSTTLFLAPEEITRDWPARNNVIQTPHGAWTDSFGAGLPRWSIRGTTGWRARKAPDGVLSSDRRMDGYMAFAVLEEMVIEYFAENRKRSIEAAQSGRVLKPLLQFAYYNQSDDEYWEVEPDGVPTKRRSKDRPLLYEYDLTFTGLVNLKDATTLVYDPNGEAVIGSEARNQRMADGLSNATGRTKTQIAAYATAASASPGDAGEIDRVTNDWISRNASLEHESFDGWQDTDIHRVLTTAGPASTVFQTATQATTTPTFLSRCKQLMANVEAFGNAVSAFRNKAEDTIAMPFKTVSEIAKGIRDVMNAIAFASSALVLGAKMRTALRTLRTEFRNLFCAVQSLLAFPYNFVKGLRENLQAILDLFKLSGCASTFPRVKALSWQPSAKLRIPPPTGG